MKKNPHSMRAKLGHHARQRAQTDMIVHGWRPTNMGNAAHDEHGSVGKEQGRAYVDPFGTSGRSGVPLFVEWDTVPTIRVLWLYKLLKARGLL